MALVTNIRYGSDIKWTKVVLIVPNYSGSPTHSLMEVGQVIQEICLVPTYPLGCPTLNLFLIEWPNQNSKTTFIVQTFPKYGPYGFDLVNLSLLGPILAKFQFCWFSGLFWAFFPSKKCKHENLSPHFNFWSITLNFFLWTPTTHEPEWLTGCSSIQKKCKNATP